MGRSVWKPFLALFARRGSRVGSDGEGRRFVPSPLDLSIRVAHGGPEDDVERELSRIDERARVLEDDRRGD